MLAAWYLTDWVQGSAPVVSQQVEASYQLFNFHSSKVKMNIFDTKETLRPGGSAELVPGDRINIIGIRSSETLFSGLVDTQIGWNPIDGVLSFFAIGWLGQINQLIAGRSSSSGDGSRYYKRYQTDYYNNGEQIEVEVMVTPATYETTWINSLAKRIGFAKESIFNTRAISIGRVFSNSNSPLYDQNLDDRDEWYRPVSRGYLYEVEFETIIDELVRQISLQTGETYTTGNIDFDTISTAFPSPIALSTDQTFVYAMFFWTDSDNLICFGGIDENEARFSLVKNLNIYRITSKVDLEERGDGAIFGCQVWGFGNYPTEWITLEAAGFRNQGVIPAIDNRFGGSGLVSWYIDDDLINFHGIYRIDMLDGRYILYQLWSWVEFDFRIYSRQDNRPRLYSRSHCEFFVIDPADGRVSPLGHSEFDSPNPQILESCNFGTEAGLNYIISKIPTMPKSMFFHGDLPAPGDNYTGEDNIEFSYNTITQSPNAQGNGGEYFNVDGVLAFQGDIDISRIAFEFTGKRIVDIFLEIAKLTNSVFYIDNNKTLHFVNRNYYSESAVVILDSVMRVISESKRHTGSSVPNIGSSIINNQAYNKALNDYYVDTYFTEDETLYKINCLDTENNMSVDLFGRIEFEYQGVKITAVVQSFSIAEGNMNITAKAIS